MAGQRREDRSDLEAREVETHGDARAMTAADGQGRDADVFLDIPMLKIGEVDLKLTTMRAHVALHAQVGNLVTLEIGADVSAGEMELQLRDVEAQARLEVRLEDVRKIVERSLATIDRQPEVLQLAAAATSGAERAEAWAASAEASALPTRPGDAEPTGDQPEPSGESESERPGGTRRVEGRSLASRALSRALVTPRVVLRRARSAARRMRGRPETRETTETGQTRETREGSGR